MKKIKLTLGWLALAFMAFGPVAIWAIERPLADRFSGAQSILASLGQVSGLLGMALFAISLILSARVRWMEDWISSLDRMYLSHHKIGAVSFILLLFHPLFIAARIGMNSVRNAALFLLPSLDNLPKTYGIVSLLMMVVLLVITFYCAFRYHTWRLTHKFLGFAYLVAMAHAFLIPTDISRDPILFWAMMAISILAMAAFVYRSLLARWLAPKYSYVVEQVTPLASGIFEIVMKPQSKAMEYEAGQFAYFSFIQDGLTPEFHPFSFASGSNENPLVIGVKMLGDWTARLGLLKPGAKVKIEGPFGRFHATSSDFGEEVWVAGGIGITPFLSIARSLDQEHRKIHLFYCFMNPKDAVFLNELKAAVGSNPNFTLTPFCTAELGRLDAERLVKWCGGCEKKEFYFCGPSPMVKPMIRALRKMGVRPNHIHSEDFQYV